MIHGGTFRTFVEKKDEGVNDTHRRERGSNWRGFRISGVGGFLFLLLGVNFLLKIMRFTCVLRI